MSITESGNLNEYFYEVGVQIDESVDEFILSYLSGSKIVQEAHLSKDELRHAMWLLSEERAGRVARVSELLTPMEKRIFLCAMLREREALDKEDGLRDSKERLKKICDSIERKVKEALWERSEVDGESNKG